MHTFARATATKEPSSYLWAFHWLLLFRREMCRNRNVKRTPTNDQGWHVGVLAIIVDLSVPDRIWKLLAKSLHKLCIYQQKKNTILTSKYDKTGAERTVLVKYCCIRSAARILEKKIARQGVYKNTSGTKP